MEQAIVKNTSNEEVAVMFDGFQNYFKPGQKKAFSKGVAEHIANEDDRLEVITEETAEVLPEAEEAPEVAVEPVEKKFACKKCDFTTASKGELLGHYKTHKK